MHCSRSESAANRNIVPASMIVIVAPSHVVYTQNASVDSCRVALKTILFVKGRQLKARVRLYIGRL